MQNTVTDNGCGVRERLLQAAFEVFAEQGYKNTTVRDICCKADVNVAAINYYFGGKQALYEEVCRYSCGAAGEIPPLFPIDAGASPEEKLTAFINLFMQAILLRGAPSLQGKIMAREMMEPSSAIHIIVQEIIRPRHEQLAGIIRELLGNAIDDALVRRCCFSIAGQCLYYRFARAVALELHPGLNFDERTVDEIARHISRFTISALRGITREA
jgi:TetR/AcrR family transcriptional regulator, regulator of cefoperazone and chloramphenicol sensitivity